MRYSLELVLNTQPVLVIAIEMNVMVGSTRTMENGGRRDERRERRENLFKPFLLSLGRSLANNWLNFPEILLPV
jgi:hypothetical protein